MKEVGKTNSVKKAIVLLAGYGTRFLPFTKAVPKALLPVVNRPAIQIVLQELADAGITDAALIVGYKKEIIRSYFSASPELERDLANNEDLLKSVKYPESMINIQWIQQKNLNGTGGALMLAKKYAKDEPFAVLFADDLMYNDYPVIRQLMDVFDKTGKPVMGCRMVKHEDVPKYASVEYSERTGSLYHVTRITEKPRLEDVKSDLSPLGRYILTPEIFSVLEKIQPGANNEICLTDAFGLLAEKNGIDAFEFEGIRYDMGNKLGFLKANVEEGLRDSEISAEFREYLKRIINEK